MYRNLLAASETLEPAIDCIDISEPLNLPSIVSQLLKPLNLPSMISISVNL